MLCGRSFIKCLSGRLRNCADGSRLARYSEVFVPGLFGLWVLGILVFGACTSPAFSASESSIDSAQIDQVPADSVKIPPIQTATGAEPMTADETQLATDEPMALALADPQIDPNIVSRAAETNTPVRSARFGPNPLEPWTMLLALMLFMLIVTSMVGIQRARLMLERQKVEQERALVRRLQQVDKIKDEFLANTSHELLTPLNGIIGLAESLLDATDQGVSDPARRSLELIVASGKRLATLVKDILDFSALRNQGLSLHPQPLNLRLLVDLVLPLLQPLVASKRLRLINEVPEDLPAVLADEGRLMQILNNLIDNAVKFTERGVVRVSACRQGDNIEIQVADTGIGIADEHLSEIFEAFHQVENTNERRFGGSGLGLSITRQLVELQGGQIWVSSEVNRGSRFYFTLPLSLDKPQNTDSRAPESVRMEAGTELAAEPKAPHTGYGEAHVLVVDDDPVNRKVLHNYLVRRGYQVSEVESGEDALTFIAQHPVDLILLDIMMPKLSGYDTCKRLRETYPAHELPIIFLTALNQMEDIVTGFDTGANDYLTKPIAKEELLARVSLHLQLLGANRDLDQKVAERTQELALRNEGLRQAQSDLQAAYRKLELASLTDPLTGLHNRRFLSQSIGADVALVEREYQRWLQQETPATADTSTAVTELPQNHDLIFLLLDVDHFKQINDEYGHAAGDLLLEQLGQRLRDTLRESDYLVRWGGEEFLVVARFGNRTEAPEMAERLRQALTQKEFDLGQGNRAFRSCSLGYAVYPFFPHQPDALTWEQVVNTADRALYIAKNSGRNTWVGISGCDEDDQRVNPALSKNLASLVAARVIQLDSHTPLEALQLGE